MVVATLRLTEHSFNHYISLLLRALVRKIGFFAQKLW